MVDGLDEDLHPEGLPSVASLLPAPAGSCAHVLVTSRLEPDVPVEHPLWTPPASRRGSASPLPRYLTDLTPLCPCPPRRR
jgi:hypothetical protein